MAVGKRKADDKSPEVPNNVIEAPITPRWTSVGETLRRRRIECGLDIDHVAQVLRIRPAVLIAIEDGQVDQLPGPTYAVGFVRSYATYLGLDADALVLRFKTETSEISQRPHLQFPLPMRDSRVPTGPLLIICILLAAITYGGWYYFFARPGSQLADMVPNVPDRLHHLLAVPAPQPRTIPPAGEAASAPPVAPAVRATQTPQPTAPQQQAAVPTPPPSHPSAPEAAVDGVPPVESPPTATTTAPALPASPDLTQPTLSSELAKNPADGIYGAPEGQSRVVLRANADSWIQVRDKSSNLLFTRVLKPGEHYNVPNQPGLILIAGNAGGLDIAVDGMNLPHIGELGRVARNVSLDPDHLLGTPVHAN